MKTIIIGSGQVTCKLLNSARLSNVLVLMTNSNTNANVKSLIKKSFNYISADKGENFGKMTDEILSRLTTEDVVINTAPSIDDITLNNLKNTKAYVIYISTNAVTDELVKQKNDGDNYVLQPFPYRDRKMFEEQQLKNSCIIRCGFFPNTVYFRGEQVCAHITVKQTLQNINNFR